jgi:hypothetical protein
MISGYISDYLGYRGFVIWVNSNNSCLYCHPAGAFITS